MPCYHVSGVVGQNMAPCNHTALAEGKATTCCSEGYLCLDNGMCRGNGLNDQTNYFWRTGCTDKTWRDEACGNYCRQVPSDSQDWFQLIWKCPENEKYCCNTGDEPKYEDRVGKTNTSCCGITDLQFDAPNPRVYTTARFLGSAFSIATSMMSNASPTGARSTSSTSPDNTVGGGSSLNKPTRRKNSGLGIGLGVAFGVVALVAIVAIVIIVHRRRKLQRARNVPPVEIMDKDPSELGKPEKPAELVSPLTPDQDPRLR